MKVGLNTAFFADKTIIVSRVFFTSIWRLLAGILAFPVPFYRSPVQFNYSTTSSKKLLIKTIDSQPALCFPQYITSNGKIKIHGNQQFPFLNIKKNIIK